MVALLLVAFAAADTLVLDNGAVLQGELTAYQRGGECRVAVSEGELADTVVVLPCGRIARFERDPETQPVPEPTIAEVALDPVSTPVGGGPVATPVDADPVADEDGGPLPVGR